MKKWQDNWIKMAAVVEIREHYRPPFCNLQLARGILLRQGDWSGLIDRPAAKQRCRRLPLSPSISESNVWSPPLCWSVGSSHFKTITASIKRYAGQSCNHESSRTFLPYSLTTRLSLLAVNGAAYAPVFVGRPDYSSGTGAEATLQARHLPACMNT